jgi:pimeloyl-ACP methyl ester carboxylesterase
MGLTFLAADGTPIAYDDRGQGLPVLCLPGLTRTMADFDDLLPHLPDLRVIRMDFRGRGRSGWSGAATYTIAQEAEDVLGLIDHLGLGRVAIIGTSRGGLVAMWLSAVAKHRLRGVCLNDIGPVIHRPGLDAIKDHVGRNPPFRTHAELAAAMPALWTGFDGIPPARWLAEARRLYRETPEGLAITYDPALRQAFLSSYDGPPVDSWPLFDTLDGLPLALVRGVNSDLLTLDVADEMQRRRPDMIRAEVPGRGHIPFLDEPESLAAIRAWLARL